MKKALVNYSFLKTNLKNKLLKNYNEQIKQFEQQIKEKGIETLGDTPKSGGFICKHYKICSADKYSNRINN